MDLTAIEIEAWADAFVLAEQDPQLLKVADHPLWWSVERFMLLSGGPNPEDCWKAILAVLRKTSDAHVLGMLAAGPLEDLVEAAGAQFIERIEAEARNNLEFCRLLQGINEGGPPAVWARIEAARSACNAT